MQLVRDTEFAYLCSVLIFRCEVSVPKIFAAWFTYLWRKWVYEPGWYGCGGGGMRPTFSYSDYSELANVECKMYRT